jgi:hypothetical protein
MMLMRFLLALAALLLAPAAAQASDIALASQVLVERQVQRADGRTETVREAPGLVVPGDRLLFLLGWRNEGAAPVTGFVLTNPMPDAVRFVAAGDGEALVSVDGGAAFGRLAELRVALPEGGSRAAEAGDVTHVRWRFDAPIAPGASGELSFSAIVK